MARRVVVVALALLLVVGCAPYPRSPVGDWESSLCERVRSWVQDGSLPVEHAQRWYGQCAPFWVGGHDE